MDAQGLVERSAAGLGAGSGGATLHVLFHDDLSNVEDFG